MPVGSFWHFTNKRAGTLILNQSVRESNIFINESFRNMYAFFYKLWHNQTNLLNLKKVIRTCKKPIFYPILTFILMSFIKYITLVLYYGHSTLQQKNNKNEKIDFKWLVWWFTSRPVMLVLFVHIMNRTDCVLLVRVRVTT